MKFLKYIFVSFLTSFSMVACSDGLDNIEYQSQSDVTVKLVEVSSAAPRTVSLKAEVSGNVANVARRGFCYSLTNAEPTVKDASVNADDNFVATADGLKAGSTYYFRAYVYGNSRYTYSDAMQVTTGQQSLTEQLDSYVAPEYADNYVGISSWGNRDKWNLSNVHDPTVVLTEDGYYYMYQTDASYGNVHAAGGHVHARRSRNLVDWEYLGGTIKNLPSWIIPKLNEIRVAMGLQPTTSTEADFGVGCFWAPCVRKVRNGLYRMYYSVVCPGNINGPSSWTERAFIGVMENTNPANNDGWVDKGYVITNASDKGLNFNVNPTSWANCYFKWNAIDPSYIIGQDSKHYLVYGSWHSGIAVVEINPETGKLAAELPNPWSVGSDGIAPYGKLIATRKMNDRWQASEAPEIVYHDGYYYLFLAYDALDVPYNTRVVRSKNIEGPYLGIDGKNVTQSGGDALPVVTHPYKFNNSHGWVGISHCCVFDDGNGNWFFASQGRFPANVDGNQYSNAIMMGHVRRMVWTADGWPLVMPERYGAVPSVPVSEQELAGNWEHIDLSYSQGKQKTSVNMTLAADHSVTDGPWKGQKWSYSPDTQVLAIGGINFYVQREVDWESTPRRHTLVYAACNASKTYWGKKVN